MILVLLPACCVKAARLACRPCRVASFDAITRLAPYAGRNVAAQIAKFTRLTTLALTDHALGDAHWCWHILIEAPPSLYNLQVLKLGWGFVAQAQSIVKLPRVCPHLSALAIEDAFMSYKYRVDETARTSASGSILLLTSLKELHITATWIRWCELLPNLTALVNLQSLRRVFASAPPCCKALAALTQLTDLAVSFSCLPFGEDRRSALAPLKALRSLDVHGDSRAMAVAVARGLPALQRFRVSPGVSLEGRVGATFGFEGSLLSLEHLGLEVQGNVWSFLLPQMSLLTRLTLLEVNQYSENGLRPQPATFLSSLLRLRHLRLEAIVPAQRGRAETIRCLALPTNLEFLHLDVRFDGRSTAVPVGHELVQPLMGLTRLQRLRIWGAWCLEPDFRRALEMRLPALGPRTCPCGEGPDFDNV